MENPYEDWLGDIGKALRRGWDECQKTLKAEQAEIVSELVEACSEARLYLQNQAGFIPERATKMLEQAIAKAKEGY